MCSLGTALLKCSDLAIEQNLVEELKRLKEIKNIFDRTFRVIIEEIPTDGSLYHNDMLEMLEINLKLYSSTYPEELKEINRLIDVLKNGQESQKEPQNNTISSEINQRKDTINEMLEKYHLEEKDGSSLYADIIEIGEENIDYEYLIPSGEKLKYLSFSSHEITPETFGKYVIGYSQETNTYQIFFSHKQLDIGEKTINDIYNIINDVDHFAKIGSYHQSIQIPEKFKAISGGAYIFQENKILFTGKSTRYGKSNPHTLKKLCEGCDCDFEIE